MFNGARRTLRTNVVKGLYVCCMDLRAAITLQPCFDVLLTVHLSIMLVINQLNAQHLVL